MDISFIVIDDTELDHFIAKKLISHADPRFGVKEFYDPTVALAYIANNNTGNCITLIFLDIYMPVMNGFQFVDAFEKLDPAIQQKYYIVALTSSKERNDLSRINDGNIFKGVINKPITAEDLSAVLNKVIREYGIKMI